LCTSIPIYLALLVIKGCSFLDGLRQAPKPYSKRGALLYCVLAAGNRACQDLTLYDARVSGKRVYHRG
jgi:hypothetical protein